ncbi:putative scaffolding protein [Aeromonas phage LAh_9]|uniref:Putative scaffolding protein n=1 Tax=Aeromonas phage LAh_9 TaxID=2591033 RepID=A0A514A0T4_9CAUD|nr:head scaffolding protein [Aeromonas phage LAh_9]QDH46880.1 putative scaffolding protein [Aeromonas phage LAh_9]
MNMDTNEVVVADEMVLDMKNVDFFSLDDDNISVVDKSTKPEAAKPEPTKEVEADNVEDENHEVESEFDFDKIDDEDSSDDTDGDDKDSDDNGDTDSDDSSDDDSDDDSEEETVDYEAYEVTLPGGETVSLAEAIKGYKDAEALSSERKEFEDARVAFETQSKEIADFLELAKLEADRVIEDYDGFDWAGLAKSDPAAYVDNKEFLEKYQVRQREIQDAMKVIQDKKRADEEALVQTKARECSAVLARDIPGWSQDLYVELMHYAVDNGANPEEIQNCVDPVVFKALFKAKQFDSTKTSITAKIKKAVKSPTKVVKADAKEQETSTPPQKIQLIKKLEKGSFGTKDVDSMFNFLED